MRTRRRNRNLLKQQRVKIHNHCCHRHPQTHQLRQLQIHLPHLQALQRVLKKSSNNSLTLLHISRIIPNPNQSQQEQLGIEDETFKTSLGLDISVSLLGFLNKPEASSNSNGLRSFTANVESPFSGADPFAIGGLIQSPMVNQATNSMTSSYFNHNFTTQATNHNNSINGANNQINFNSSSFPLANLDVSITFSSHANSPTMNFSEDYNNSSSSSRYHLDQSQPQL